VWPRGRVEVWLYSSSPVVSPTPRPQFTTGKESVPILQEDGWAPGPVWTSGKSRPHRDSIPDCPARSQSLYRLSYPASYYYVSYTLYTKVFKISSFLTKILLSFFPICHVCFTSHDF